MSNLILLFFLCCFLLVNKANSQSTADTIAIRGCLIADSSYEGISNAAVKITSKNRPQILAYLNTGRGNCFSARVSFLTADTFFITVTHPVYQTITLPFFITGNQASVPLEIILPLQKNVLPGVLVKAPPVWIRGDTTFYKADHFKEGEEKKLKDLIVKIPGFEIDNDGNLLYRKKNIEKIMIEGEELFSDKITLLLNSFPVHVINTVQALENQTSNKLLKGLTADNKVFVNLGIKKEKLKAVFGDGEAGTGTAGRYLLAPTLFALQGKARIGFIGNENNTGNGFDWGEEKEITTKPVQEAGPWLMNDQYLQTVNNFSSRRYISNQKWDNRLQANIPLSQRLKSKTEISFLKDRQRQNTFYNSSLYNDSFYFKRTDTNAIRHQPLLFLVNQELTWDISTIRQLKINAQFYRNATQSIHEARFREETLAYSSENNIRNDWKSFSLQAELTHRKSALLATRWFTHLSHSNMQQLAQGISPNWPGIFQLAGQDYTRLQQNLTTKTWAMQTGLERMQKTNSGMAILGITGNWSHTAIGNDVSLSDLAGNYPALFTDSLSNRGRYETARLNGYWQRSWPVLGLPLFFKASYGMAWANISEPGNNKSFITPLYSLEINQRSRLSKTVSYSYSLAYSQQQAEPYQLNGIALLSAVNAFSRNANTYQPVKQLKASFHLGTFLKKFSSLNLITSYVNNFSSLVSGNTYNQLLLATVDSLVNRSTHYLHTSLNASMPSLWLKTKFEIGADYSIGTGYVMHLKNILPVNYSWYHAMIRMKRNWNKKYFIETSGHYSITDNRVPAISKNLIKTKVADFRGLLKQRLNVLKTTGLALSTEYYRYNIRSGNNSGVFFADLELTHSLPKKHLSFSLLFSNITNERYFYYMNNTPLQQSFYAFPLIKRNVFLTIRYEL